MIRFPVGFDIGQLLSDYVLFASPFIVIALLIATFIIIKKALNRI
jgi:hypothetical protein